MCSTCGQVLEVAVHTKGSTFRMTGYVLAKTWNLARTHGCMVSRLAHLIYKTPSFSLAPDCLAAMQTCLCNPHSIASQAKLPRNVSVQAGTQAMYTSLIAMR